MNSFKLLPDALLPWYAQNARKLPWRENADPYRVWVSEIMLQQTRVEAVIGYYARFLEAFPTVQDLAEASQDRLFKLWEGLGYYSRAKNLQKAALVICEKFGGAFPQDYNSIRTLPGVGPYTAGAIASICFGLPKAAVDGNVLRVTARFLNDDTPIDSPVFKTAVTQSLEEIYPAGKCGTFTQALMELGATVCTPKSPKCDTCPLKDKCLANQNGTQSVLPVKTPKKEKTLVRKTVFLFFCGEELAIHKRPATGLLSSMWELPNIDVSLDASEAMQKAQEMGLCPKVVLWETEQVHIFTHIRWEMVGYAIACEKKTDEFVWKTREEIGMEYALPTAFRKFLEASV